MPLSASHALHDITFQTNPERKKAVPHRGGTTRNGNETPPPNPAGVFRILPASRILYGKDAPCTFAAASFASGITVVVPANVIVRV